jgi:hypothetical protein
VFQGRVCSRLDAPYALVLRLCHSAEPQELSNIISFAAKGMTMSISALPPDVRRWLCPAVEVHFTFWATPLLRPLA